MLLSNQIKAKYCFFFVNNAIILSRDVRIMEDTICAVATAIGTGSISIIRISGNAAIDITSRIFDGKNLKKVLSHTINYGYIKDKKELIDEVLVTVMKAPKTFTKEDVVEINCHGGIAAVNKILELLLTNGCRLAEPGEFTKRAFLNGRIDLVEAEAVNDIINAETQKARNLAINQIQKSLSLKINDLRSIILELLANIEVNIDYPEYEDAEEITKENLKPKLVIIKDSLKELLSGAENGKMIKEGITTAIIGRPNVGKSSILNHLLEENKAIVTNIEGTTRDIVEGKFLLNGILFNLIDTAGIRHSSDIIEQIGIDKSYQNIEKAQLVILVLNNNESLTKDDLKLLAEIKHKNNIVFVNKNDLESKIDKTILKKFNYCSGNTMTENGLNELKEKIVELFNLDKLSSNNLTYLSNARQISLVKKSLDKTNYLLVEIDKDIPIDMLAIDLKIIYDLLGEIIGSTYKEELLDELFSKFCLGK